jgi:hypothetical protein
MVPGISERERLVADMQRLEWLADAYAGPAGNARAQRRTLASERSWPARAHGLATCAFTMGRHFCRRLHALRPSAVAPTATVAEASGR